VGCNAVFRGAWCLHRQGLAVKEEFVMERYCVLYEVGTELIILIKIYSIFNLEGPTTDQIDKGLL